MNLAVRILWTLICFELGVLLILVPWTDFWQRNFFIEHYPGLIPWLLSPYARGAISGLGLLDIFVAVSFLLPQKSKGEART
jgi:hypothetical protein